MVRSRHYSSSRQDVRHRPRGFTLVELITAVAVVLLGIFPGAFVDWAGAAPMPPTATAAIVK